MDEKVISNVSDLTPIADALRSTTGSTQTYSVPELAAAAVNAITSTSKYKQPDWGSEVAEVEILPQTSFGADQLTPMGWRITTPIVQSLELGKEYDVIYNGKKYTCVSKESAILDGSPQVALGNLSQVSGNDTGEPFMFVEFLEKPGGVSAMLLPLDGSTSATISIKAVDKVYHKIPGEYVGGVGKYKQPEWGLESGGIVEILPQTSVVMDRVIDGAFVVATPLTNPIVDGNDYIIDYNGNQYTCKAFETIMGPGLTTVIGNGAAVGGNDTGEPFLIMVVPEKYVAEAGYLNVIAAPGTEEVTLSIMGEKREIHKIPSEYVEGDTVYIRQVNGNYHAYADKHGKNELTCAEGLKRLLLSKIICDVANGDYLIPSTIHYNREDNKLEVVIVGYDTVFLNFSDSKDTIVN